MADTGGPYVQIAALCEKVLQEKDGVLSVITWHDNPVNYQGDSRFEQKSGQPAGRRVANIKRRRYPSQRYGRKPQARARHHRRHSRRASSEKFRRHQQHAAKSSVGISCSIRGSVGGEDYAED